MPDGITRQRPRVFFRAASQEPWKQDLTRPRPQVSRWQLECTSRAEVTADVFESDVDVPFELAENCMHATKAILNAALGD